MKASRYGYLEIAKLIIGKGAEVKNVRNKINETPLIKASFGGHFQIGKLLLNHGADVNAKDKYGKTALMIWCICNSF